MTSFVKLSSFVVFLFVYIHFIETHSDICKYIDIHTKKKKNENIRLHLYSRFIKTCHQQQQHQQLIQEIFLK